MNIFKFKVYLLEKNSLKNKIFLNSINNMDMFRQGRSFLNDKMHNTMIQHSVFAGIVFIIVAHPKTFALVDSVLKVQDKNILLLVHGVLVSLLMYFGSIYLFEPVQKMLLEGMRNRKK